jgi:hypothetical protein
MLGKFARVAVVGAAITAPIGAYAFLVRPWVKRWGVDATEAATMLPGDDIVADATAVETRGITIGAAPVDVWPWLVQMGYGRAGFYSYDRLDTKAASAHEIVPEWQSLEVGGMVPTHPEGGFEVRVLDPGKALVLYVDNVMAQQWTMKPAAEAAPAGVQASGAFLGASMPSEFKGTWTFVLTPTPDGDTRLVERLRFHFGAEGQPGFKFAAGALGFGIFLMMRKQMLGIRDRAQQLARTKLPTPYAPQAEVPASA